MNKYIRNIISSVTNSFPVRAIKSVIYSIAETVVSKPSFGKIVCAMCLMTPIVMATTVTVNNDQVFLSEPFPNNTTDGCMWNITGNNYADFGLLYGCNQSELDGFLSINGVMKKVRGGTLSDYPDLTGYTDDSPEYTGPIISEFGTDEVNPNVGTREIELHVMLDQSFQSRFTTQQAMVNTVNMIRDFSNTLFANVNDWPVNIQVKISRLDIWSPDLISGTLTESSALLNQFELATRSIKTGDSRVLLTGRDLDGSTIGIAFTGSMCFQHASTVVQAVINNQITPEIVAKILTHELTHNLGARHDGGSVPGLYDNTGCPTSGFIMAPSLSSATGFSTCTAQNIASLWYSPTNVQCLSPVVAPPQTIGQLVCDFSSPCLTFLRQQVSGEWMGVLQGSFSLPTFSATKGDDAICKFGFSSSTPMSATVSGTVHQTVNNRLNVPINSGSTVVITGSGFIDNLFLSCECDNCPSVRNPDQSDLDNDGIGDVCDACPLPPCLSATSRTVSVGRELLVVPIARIEYTGSCKPKSVSLIQRSSSCVYVSSVPGTLTFNEQGSIRRGTQTVSTINTVLATVVGEYCLVPAMTCKSDGQSCSGVTGECCNTCITPMKLCTNCNVAGATCNHNDGCCTKSCVSGKCVGNPPAGCTSGYTGCTSDGMCCSGKCAMPRCMSKTGLCSQNLCANSNHLVCMHLSSNVVITMCSPPSLYTIFNHHCGAC